MALRLIQADLSPKFIDEATRALTDAGAAEVWSTTGGSFGAVVHAVMGDDRTGPAVDSLYKDIASRGPLRALVLPLDAVIPRPTASIGPDERPERVSSAAVSREEIYASIAGNARLTPNFLTMVVLATIVAAIGLTKDNTAAVIGAMVVAPLLGPNMALALGLTLGDRALIVRAAKSSSVGLMLCFSLSTALAFFLDVDPRVGELASRTSPDIADIVLAICAGAAGTLAYTTGASTYLVGVMVAVALLPPTVASGLFLGHSMLAEAAGAGLLASVNAVALVLASMLTFLAGGMRPRLWWREEQARQSSWRGALVLAALLALLAVLMLLSTGEAPLLH